MPVAGRFPSAQVLDVHGRLFLIDCGEGVQFSLVNRNIPILKFDSIYISHIHGDHVFGLFGLLSTMGMKGRTNPLHIYGPNSLSPIIKFFLSYYGEGIKYEIEFHPLKSKEPEEIYHGKSVEIQAFPLNHKIDTYGFLFREKKPMLNVHKYRIEQYGLSISEIATLKRGEDVHRTDLILKNEEMTYVPFVPRSYAYCSDNAVFPELASWVKNTDVLYHETTYLKSMKDLASERYHSTTEQVASLALEAGVGRLLIGHYSSRFKNIGIFEQECKEIFENTTALKDGDEIEI